MNPFIWCAVGVVCGWIATVIMPVPGLASRIESVLVAIFGAFIGGEFLSSLFSAVPEPAGAAAAFQMSSLALAVTGAVVMLTLLRLMRTAVGPMRPHKTRKPRQ